MLSDISFGMPSLNKSKTEHQAKSEFQKKFKRVETRINKIFAESPHYISLNVLIIIQQTNFESLFEMKSSKVYLSLPNTIA